MSLLGTGGGWLAVSPLGNGGGWLTVPMVGTGGGWLAMPVVGTGGGWLAMPVVGTGGGWLSVPVLVLPEAPVGAGGAGMGIISQSRSTQAQPTAAAATTFAPLGAGLLLGEKWQRLACMCSRRPDTRQGKVPGVLGALKGRAIVRARCKPFHTALISIPGVLGIRA